MAKDSHKILPNFLNMMYRLHNEGSPVAQLMTTLHSKSTNVNLLTTGNFVHDRLCLRLWKRKNIFQFIAIVRFNFVKLILTKIWSLDNCEKETLLIEKFVKYVNLLMPLMSDIWLEVCSDEKVESYTEITILSKL